MGRLLAATRGAVAFFAVLVAASAFARTTEVCTGPGRNVGCFTIDTSLIGGRPFGDYVVARRGPLLVDVEARRAELAPDPYQAGLYCAVNPAAAVAVHGLPTVDFDSATVRLFETRVETPEVRRIREYAIVAFEGLRNSDGVAYPKFGLTFNRQQNDPVLRLEFFPSNDANLQSIPALTRDVYLNVDVATGANGFQRLDDLEPGIRADAARDRLPTSGRSRQDDERHRAAGRNRCALGSPGPRRGGCDVQPHRLRDAAAGARSGGHAELRLARRLWHELPRRPRRSASTAIS